MSYCAPDPMYTSAQLVFTPAPLGQCYCTPFQLRKLKSSEDLAEEHIPSLRAGCLTLHNQQMVPAPEQVDTKRLGERKFNAVAQKIKNNLFAN